MRKAFGTIFVDTERQETEVVFADFLFALPLPQQAAILASVLQWLENEYLAVASGDPKPAEPEAA